VWIRNPGLADAFRYPAFMADAAVRSAFWKSYVEHAAWQAEPNAAHRALADLERAPWRGSRRRRRSALRRVCGHPEARGGSVR
jgi:hypothetical protein